uniref:(California timema) hypothetical protein n=1 Tax=Timema californicum TaxID=61474 RepID=A0A7R9IXZ0_TIMCA|nr:unnamed protein product [Timema californicum]
MQILCVHGYRQNGNAFKSKLGGFRKSLKKYAEFVFFDAPHTICLQDNTEVSEADTPEQYGWWFSEEDRTFMSKKPSDTCIGFEESLARVEELCEKEGPFDGLLGFSQGAAFVGLLCQLQEMKCLKFNFNFAIIIAGFVSRCSPHAKYYLQKVTIPSMHVCGETDGVIPKEMSQELAAHFQDPLIVTHPGGHFVPASEPTRHSYISFLQERMA